MRISDWSSDVCSSDLDGQFHRAQVGRQVAACSGHRLQHESAQLPGQVLELAAVQLAQVGGRTDLIEHCSSHTNGILAKNISGRARRYSPRWQPGDGWPASGDATPHGT